MTDIGWGSKWIRKCWQNMCWKKMIKMFLCSKGFLDQQQLVMVISGRSHIHSYEWTSIYGVIFTTNLWLVLISMATVLCPSVAALVKKDGQNWLRISSLPILYTGTYVSSTIHNRHILLIWELLNPSFLTSEKDKFIPQGILQMTLPCLKLWRLWVKYKCLV